MNNNIICYYGTEYVYKNVTQLVIDKFIKDDYIIIQKLTNLDTIFGSFTSNNINKLTIKFNYKNKIFINNNNNYDNIINIKTNKHYKINNFNFTKKSLIISINVHEKPNFLKKQLKNIKNYVKCDYIIILNCNLFMFEQLLYDIEPNYIINPNYLNKNVFHGSLTHGIYLNIQYIMKYYKFDKFLIMSSRDFFYNIIDNVKLKNLPYYYGDKIDNNYITYIQNNNSYIPHIDKHYNLYISYKQNCNIPPEYNGDNSYDYIWHWPLFKFTKLFQYFYKNYKKEMSKSAHEGIIFDYKNITTIIEFLENNNNIKEEIFNFNYCMEEFAFQTITYNINGYYYYIGNGWKTLEKTKLLNNRFTYKIVRE